MALKKTFHDICAEAKARIHEVTTGEVQQRLDETGRDWLLVDVRENDEFRAGHLPGALGIGRGILEYHIADVAPDTEQEIVLYCRGGFRSALSADSLRDMGYTNVHSMIGGYRAWENEGRPTTTEGEPIKH